MTFEEFTLAARTSQRIKSVTELEHIYQTWGQV
jgi:hypothetical protein